MSNFEKVKNFMTTYGQEVKESASFPDENIIKLRLKLIKEELEELEQSLNDKNILEKQIAKSQEIINNFKKEKSSEIASSVLLNQL